MAVAKVEALTKQLEDLRRDRRGPLNLITATASGLTSSNATVTANGLSANNGASSLQQHSSNSTSPAARELDKLRRELMVTISNHTYTYICCFHVARKLFLVW